MLELSEDLQIGDAVTMEPGVMILTSTHELDFPQHRAGKIITKPVSVGDGAWLRARAIVLPGVNIGSGAIVETGAQVMVPLFITIGERIKIDTRTDSYLGRETS